MKKKNVELPLDIKTPITTYGMSEEEIAELVKEGLESAKYGTYTIEEMDAIFGRERVRKQEKEGK